MKIESRLGKGLSAFFNDENKNVPIFNSSSEQENKVEVETKENLKQNGIVYIPVGNIVTNKNQPRKVFKEEQLRELASSIGKNGVLQPILVRKTKNPVIFEIIAGERRWRASNLAGIYEIPTIIKDFTDKEAFEIGLIENLQRENLSVIEEAVGYKKLMSDFNYTQEEVAKLVSKSRSYVANILRLLNLPQDVQNMILEGEISYTVARTLIGSENPLETAKSIVKKELSVRDAEQIKTLSKINKSSNNEEENGLEEELISLKKNLMEYLNVKVDIKCKNNKGELIIKFDNLSELDSIMNKLNNI